MVALNALEIIVYIKERSLCQGNMYLVINQAVADVFVGGFVIILCWFLGSMCDFWAIPSLLVPRFSCMSLLSISSFLQLHY